jgi:hypothetical protein
MASNGRQLFVARLRREGRYPEWSARLKQLHQETGKSYLLIMDQVMQEMGYVSCADEKARVKQFEASVQETGLQADLTFLEVFNRLPRKAPRQIELDWVAAHPLMSEFDRRNDPSVHIKVLGKHLLAVEDGGVCEHGECKSQVAANELQHWCNHTGEFYKRRLSDSPKRTEETAKGGVEEDLTLAEVERLLKSLNTDTVS